MNRTVLNLAMRIWNLVTTA